MLLSNAGDKLARWSAGRRSHTPATGWRSKYAAASRSDLNFGSGNFAEESSSHIRSALFAAKWPQLTCCNITRCYD